MRTNFNITSWSLEKKFRILTLLASSLIALMLVAGAIKHYKFYRHSNQVEASSKQLLTNLTTNFENTALMAEIQTDFISFTQTAHPEKMASVIEKSQRLMEQIPKEAHPNLVNFLNQAGKLEIRMASLRQNNRKALITGNKILAHIQHQSICKQRPLCLEALDKAGQTYRAFQPPYITKILNGQIVSLDRTSTEISNNFDAIIDELSTISTSLSAEQARYLTEIRELFMELEDSVATVAAIKAKVLSTKQDAIFQINQINTIFNKQSIAQQNSAINLSRQGLGIAQNAGMMMIFTFLSFTALFITLGFFISKDIIQPLNTLVQLLKNFSTLLTNIRSQNVNDNECHILLHASIADRQDEIGDVAHATMNLMLHMRLISEFRKKIEDDLSVEDVYFRLASIFKKYLKFQSFVIYEVDNSDAMTPAYIHPKELVDYLPDLTISSPCRAKRTGAIVSSLTDPAICRVCQFNDILDHICIPMLAGGQVMGVVQLILPISLQRSIRDTTNKTLDIAKNYIEEALPVIQAKRFARELEEMATKDQLTGLYNRRYLEISLQQITAGVKRRGTQLGLLMCDMDFFKQVNDSHGHDAGDIVLSKLAIILKDNVREADLVVRFGGEEFLILLIDIKPHHVKKVAEKIRTAVEGYTFHAHNVDIKKTLSIGTSLFPGEGGSGIWEIIKQADIALYKAKNSGRNRTIEFSKELWEEQAY